MVIFQHAQYPSAHESTSDFGLDHHCRTEQHPYQPLFCPVCQRGFESSDSLDQHCRDSPGHNAEQMQEYCHSLQAVQGLHNHMPTNHEDHKLGVGCLCSKTFRFRSAIAHHLESGIHGIDRHQVTAAAQALDITQTISLRRRIPNARSSPPVNFQYFATPQAFNGFAYKCPICCRMFCSISSLTTHLNSAAHDLNEFQCPLCMKQFKLISALMQHIESGSCGLVRLQKIVRHFQNTIAGFPGALEF